MRTSLRLGLSALVLAVAAAAPVAAHAQGPCGPGETLQPVVINGTTYYQCVATAAAPEVGVSSSIGGLAVLMGGALMLRGRKRFMRPAVATA